MAETGKSVRRRTFLSCFWPKDSGGGGCGHDDGDLDIHIDEL